MAASNNIADQITNAVQDAVNSKDFSNLQATIERTIDQAAEGLGRGMAQAADGIGRGLAQASDGIRRGQEQYARIQERKRREEQMNALYASPSNVRGKGVAFVIMGSCLLVPTLALGPVAAATGATTVLGAFALGAAAGAALAWVGSKNLHLARAFERYRNTIELREACTVGELAASCSESAGEVRKNLKTMLAKGLFKQASFDEQTATLLMTPQAAQRHQAALEAQREQQRQRNLVSSAHSSANEPAPLTSAQQHLLERGEAFVAAIREGNQAIPGPEISATIAQIERVVRAILDTAAEHPDVIDDLDRLMDYYLPTTVKLLDAYQELDTQPVQSESIAQSKHEIEGALAALSTGLEKLLDQLFAERALDVSADISVLRAVLAQEGLTESPFDAGKQNASSSAN